MEKKINNGQLICPVCDTDKPEIIEQADLAGVGYLVQFKCKECGTGGTTLLPEQTYRNLVNGEIY